MSRGTLTLDGITDSAVLSLGRMLPHSVHPKCKLKLLLALRCCSRILCLHWSGFVLVERINLLGRHMSKDVRNWVKHIVDAGFIWQLYPAGSGQRQNLRCLRLRYGPQGIPRGMRQEYFDNCCRNKYHLGWNYVDGRLRLNLWCIYKNLTCGCD